MQIKFKSSLTSIILALTFFCGGANAESVATPIANSTASTANDSLLLTIFLKHDQSRPLGELKSQLAKQGFYTAFPPSGTEVVSWNIVMGIGQVVTLRLPASRLAEVNLALENTAWGSYRTEFYPTYDFKSIAQMEQSKAKKSVE
ncbi:hypothetical protein L8P35_17755 [Enterobacter cloacae]|uniref:hypothetical protein n=1 Tax=Enterobacter cloacae TaxID=550 RepID=UPI0020031465|nr:hypothetical protein [Enterobacter cloacae]MCK7318534.1 hypothetical protein [Enterobacter cloacae]